MYCRYYVRVDFYQAVSFLMWFDFYSLGVVCSVRFDGNSIQQFCKDVCDVNIIRIVGENGGEVLFFCQYFKSYLVLFYVFKYLNRVWRYNYFCFFEYLGFVSFCFMQVELFCRNVFFFDFLEQVCLRKQFCRVDVCFGYMFGNFIIRGCVF